MTTIDLVDACQWEVFLSVTRRTHMAFYDITGLQAVALDLWGGNIYVIG